MITFEPWWSAVCSVCGSSVSQKDITKKAFIEELRQSGWCIGRTTSVCPVCKKKTQSCEEESA